MIFVVGRYIVNERGNETIIDLILAWTRSCRRVELDAAKSGD